MTDESADRYVGAWLLVPELCHYQEGSPPLSGHYEIAQEAGVVTVMITWSDDAGVEHATSFAGPNDGRVMKTEAPVDHLESLGFCRGLLLSLASFWLC